MAFDLASARPAPKQGFDLTSAKAKAAPQAPAEPTLNDRTSAVATGLNRGAITRLAGLPVDTILNVKDLLTAAAGATYQATTGKSIPDFLEVNSDRSQYVGSGDWNERKVREYGGAHLIDPSGPIDSTSRVLHATGMGIGGAVVGGRATSGPMSNMALTRTAGMGAASAGAGAIATENGASPEWSVLASLTPQAASQAGSAGIRMAVRGGEQGRVNMEQRIRDLKEAGIESPSLGLSSGNAFIAGLENLMSKLPGSVGLYGDHRTRMIEGMMNKAGETRDLASPRFGYDVAGRAVQNDLVNNLKPRINNAFDRVNDDMVAMIPSNQRFPITNSLNALAQATAINPLAPATTGSFVQPRISELRQNMLADTNPVPGGANVGMPVNAIREIRTSIGREASSRAISGTPEQADFKQVYGGLTNDIRNAARTADMTAGPQINNRGPAERSFDRGNKLYAAGMERINRVQPFASKDAPEQAFNALARTGREDLSTLRAVKKSISGETRGTVAATIIDRLGRARPGQQNDTSDVFSPETFLTNWNRMTPQARMELFSGFKNAAQVQAQVEAMAKSASMIRDSSKIWANPSGTGGNVLAAGTLGAVATTAFTNPAAAAGTIAGLGAGRLVSQNALLNPRFGAKMAEKPASRNRLADLIPALYNAQQLQDDR